MSRSTMENTRLARRYTPSNLHHQKDKKPGAKEKKKKKKKHL
jgi:hypothetical protein